MIKRQKYIKSLVISFAVLTAIFCTGKIFAQNLTQGYGSGAILQRGMIVGLKKDDLREVEPINSDQFDRVFGVVIGANDSAILLYRDDEKVYVATTGRNVVLVSDQNGEIRKGDYVAVSSVSGIGKKANEYDPIIIGRAIEGFKGSDKMQVIGTATIKGSDGKEKNIKIGRSLVDFSISKNPRLKTEDSLPEILRRASELVAGKPVPPIRVYISLAILIVSSIIAGSIMYSGVRSSLIAVGRNPLSKKSIIRGLFQVVIIGLMVFLSGVFGVYLLLKL